MPDFFPGGEETTGPGDDAELTLVPLAPEDAGRHLGEEIRVLLDNGNDIRGVLEEVSRDTLIVREKVAGGSISLTVRKGEIRELSLLVRR